MSSQPVIEASELEGKRFISFSADTQMRQVIDHEFDSQGIRRKMLTDVYLSEPACILVSRGLGVSIVDPFTAVEFAARGSLVVKPFRPQIPYVFRMLRPKNRPSSLLAEAFAKHVHDLIEGYIAETSARIATV